MSDKELGEGITQQQRLLEVHRHTLAHLLTQQAKFTSAYVPPHINSGIIEARAEISRIKDVLRGWGIEVENHPDDTNGSEGEKKIIASRSLFNTIIMLIAISLIAVATLTWMLLNSSNSQGSIEDRPDTKIQSIRFDWDANSNNGTVIAIYCLKSQYHWLISAEITPNPRRLGRWNYGSLDGCERKNIALGVQIGDVLEVGIGASDQLAGNDEVGTRYYRVTRNEQGITWQFTREISPK